MLRGWRRTVTTLTVFVLGANVLVVVVLGGEVLLAGRGGERLPETVAGIDGVVGTPTPGLEPLRAVWLGDSTAAGVGASGPEGTVARQVAAAMAAAGGRPVEVSVLATSGAQVADVRDRQLPRLRDDGAPRPDIAFVSVGANDTTHLIGTERFRTIYAEVLDGLAPLVAPEGRVVLLGVPAMGTIPRFLEPLRTLAGVRGERLDDQVAALAAERGLTYVDIAGETGPAFDESPATTYAADDYHPSDDGYALWATAVVAALAEPPPVPPAPAGGG